MSKIATKTVKELIKRQLSCALEANDKFFQKAEECGRSVRPWDKYQFNKLMCFLKDEVTELEVEINTGQYPEQIMNECKDVINLTWFIYEKAKGKLND